MYDIWFCEYIGDIATDNYSLSYVKKIYENIEKDKLEEHINYYITEYCYSKVGKKFGCNKQCTEIIGLGGNCCLFVEELLEN